jgi:hypothetical protein
MATVRFTGTVYATSVREEFYGSNGSFDTVSYENAPSAGAIGHYDLGVTVGLREDKDAREVSRT